MPAPPDATKIAAAWNARGFSFAIWTDPPGQVWRDFSHRSDELVMLAEGELEVVVAGRSHRPAPGTELLIPAQAPHTVINIGQVPNRWFYGYRRPDKALDRSPDRA